MIYCVKRLLWSISFFLSLLIYCQPGTDISPESLNLTSEEKAWLSEERTIRIGFDPDYPPYSFLNDKNEYKGLSADYIRIIQDVLGINIVLVPGENWKKLVEAAKKREVDVITTMVRRPEREEYMAFTQSYIPVPHGIMVRSDYKKIKIKKDLTNKKVALVKGFNIQKKVSADFPDINLLPVKSTLEALHAVSTGKADATVGTIGVLSYLAAKHGIANLKIGALYDEGLKGECLAVRKDWPLLASVFNKVIDAIKESEKLRISNKWIPIIRNNIKEHKKPIRLSFIEKEWLKQHPVIRLGVDPEFIPFEFISEGGAYSGMTSDYVKILNKRLGINMQIVPNLTWKEAVEKAKKCEVDVLPCVGMTEERQKFLKYSNSYLSFYRVIITRTKTPKFIGGIGDIRKMKVAVQANSSHHGYLLEHTKIKPVLFETLSDALIAVSQGEVDAFIGNIASSSYWIQKLSLTNLKIAAPVSSEIKHLYFAVRNDWPELAGIINKGLESITPDEAAQIRNKWISIDYEPGINLKKVIKIAVNSALIVLGVLTVFVFWSRSLKKEINRRKIVEEELIKAKEEADIANNAKSDFLASMSHEIRTPMTAILGFTEIIKERITDPLLSHYIDSIHTNGKSLLKLINDILDLSKIESGKLVLQYSAVDIEELFTEMQTIFDFKAKEKGIEFLIEISETLPAVLIMDEVRLRQILINLISNALKFTDMGYVRLTAAAAKGNSPSHSLINLTISVEDTGIGIPEEDHDKVFEKFEQKTGQKIAQYGGTGLGLGITRRLTELMNGKIELASTPGKGSTFKVTFYDVEIASSKVSELKNGEFPDFERIVFEPARIIITDDVDFNREVLMAYLEQWQFELIEAENGQELLNKSKESKPDLILLDLKMPVMDGYEAARRIRNDENLKKIPIIAVTASAKKKEEAEIRKNCDSFLHKPTSKSELIKEVIHYLPHKILPKEETTVSSEAKPIIIEKPSLNHEQLVTLKTRLEELKASQWVKVTSKMTLHEIKEFCHSIEETTEGFDYPALSQWHKDIMLQTTAFNPINLRKLLKQYPDFITELQDCIENSTTTEEVKQ